MNKIAKYGFLCMALGLAASQGLAEYTPDPGMVEIAGDTTAAIGAAKGYAVDILKAAVVILGLFITWKLIKRGASKA